jgi:hypothetical protein
MNIQFTRWQRFVGFLLVLQSHLRLQRIFNALQRLLKEEWRMPRMELPLFESPWEIQEYATARFEWRPDEMKVGKHKMPLDWITNPKIVQYKLDSGLVGDGDCDDIHNWWAACLRKLMGFWSKTVKRPQAVFTLSVVWKGGGHTTCVFNMWGVTYLVDYRIKVCPTKVNVTEWLVKTILETHAEGAPLRYFVFQDEKLRVLAANKEFL